RFLLSRSGEEIATSVPARCMLGWSRMVPEFTNEPFTDYQAQPNRQAMEAALREVKGEFNRQWPLVIGGQEVTTDRWIDSLNPCEKDQVVGRVARAGAAE